MERMERTAADIERDYTRMASEMPKYYAERVKSGYILERSTQIRVGQLDEQKLLDFLMDRNTADHLDVFPEHASASLKTFEKEIFERLNSLVPVEYEDLPKLRKELGSRAKVIALDRWGNDLYTLMQRQKGATMGSGKLQYKVSKATPVEGPHFFATDVKGYYGFLRYYTEEMARLAPQNANSYLLGNAWIITVHDKRSSSPLIAGHYFDVNLPAEVYQVAPVRFFNVEVDRSRKYTIVSEVKKRDAEKRPILIESKIVQRK